MSFNQEWRQTLGFIYGMKYYLAIKNEDTINLTHKWMKLENTILMEVTQSPKDIHGMFSLINGYYSKSTDTTHRP